MVAQVTDPTRPDPTGQQPYPPSPYSAPPTYGQMPYGYAQPLTRRSRTPFVIAIGGTVVVIILICVGFVVFAVQIGAGQKNAARDNVKITHCGSRTASGQTTGDATLAITNGTTAVSGFSVTVAFTSKDGSQQYGTGVASALNLQPAQTVTAHAVGTVPILGAFVCKVDSVSVF